MDPQSLNHFWASALIKRGLSFLSTSKDYIIPNKLYAKLILKNFVFFAVEHNQTDCRIMNKKL